MTDILWAPWRSELFQAPKPKGCIFCSFPAEPPANDEKNLILARGKDCFTILNRYPYAAGHLMVIPYRHTDSIGEMGPLAGEMFAAAQKAMDALTKVMGPDGFNLGVNLGKAAGAGIEGHGHLHVVPRWSGDNNFMPVLADKRVVPEALKETWKRLQPYL